MSSGEKRPIPGADPAWGVNLPEGMDNSLVKDDGTPWDNGYNFDERDKEDEWEALAEIAEPQPTVTPEGQEPEVTEEPPRPEAE